VPNANLVTSRTVDAFQGGEREIVFLSCVRTNGMGFIGCAARTNVAMTRAKRHLFIVGKYRNLLQCASASGAERSDLWMGVLSRCTAADGGRMKASVGLAHVRHLIAAADGAPLAVDDDDDDNDVDDDDDDAGGGAGKKRKWAKKSTTIPGAAARASTGEGDEDDDPMLIDDDGPDEIARGGGVSSAAAAEMLDLCDADFLADDDDDDDDGGRDDDSYDDGDDAVGGDDDDDDDDGDDDGAPAGTDGDRGTTWQNVGRGFRVRAGVDCDVAVDNTNTVGIDHTASPANTPSGDIGLSALLDDSDEDDDDDSDDVDRGQKEEDGLKRNSASRALSAVDVSIDDDNNNDDDDDGGGAGRGGGRGGAVHTSTVRAPARPSPPRRPIASGVSSDESSPGRDDLDRQRPAPRQRSRRLVSDVSAFYFSEPEDDPADVLNSSNDSLPTPPAMRTQQQQQQ
jgi:hypothetical protein